MRNLKSFNEFLNEGRMYEGKYSSDSLSNIIMLSNDERSWRSLSKFLSIKLNTKSNKDIHMVQSENVYTGIPADELFKVLSKKYPLKSLGTPLNKEIKMKSDFFKEHDLYEVLTGKLYALIKNEIWSNYGDDPADQMFYDYEPEDEPESTDTKYKYFFNINDLKNII